jgi:hypothetical protein
MIILACNSSKKQLERGNYDEAVENSVKKLRKKANNPKEIEILENAYPKANQKDLDRISFLQKEGRPDRWEEIAKLNTNLKNRQNLVKEITPLSIDGRTVNYQYVDYDRDIVIAQRNAADFLYNNAKKIINGNDRLANRQAYYQLVKVKELNPVYADIDKLIKTAKETGTNFVMITLKNSTYFSLSNEFKEDLLSFGSFNLDNEWVKYTISPNGDELQYDYTIYVNIKKIDISPEQVKESSFEEKKKIQDGWEYDLDAKGNVRKDTSGNDIKKAKYKNISCRVREIVQHKAAYISGSVEYFENQANRKIQEAPISAEHIFEYGVCNANGDLNALTEETRKRLGNRPVPFPSDMDMIFGATQTLRDAIIDVLRRNSQIIK